MTLDEAIEHCEEKAKCGNSCGMEHKQLAEWLRELMSLRNEVDRLREESERNSRILDNLPWDMVIDAKNAVDEEDEENA